MSRYRLLHDVSRQADSVRHTTFTISASVAIETTGNNCLALQYIFATFI